MADLESQSVVGNFLALLGFGGWGYKSMTHGQRIKHLEDRLSDKSSKIDEVAEKVSNMDGKVDGLVEGVAEIRAWIMGKAK
jgi:hypothetical protein